MTQFDLPSLTTPPGQSTPPAQPTQARRSAPRRRLSPGTVLLVAILTPIALVTLLGLERFPLLPDSLNNGVGAISQVLIQLVTIIGAVALIIGILNLLLVNVRNLRRNIYGIFTLLTALGIIVLHILERANIFTVKDANVTMTLMDVVQVAIESALSGLLFFFLVFAAYRMMRRRVTFWNVLFIASLVLVLISYNPIFKIDLLVRFQEWLLRVPVGAGTRGLLIGIAIGTVTVGVRVLIGQDRTLRE